MSVHTKTTQKDIYIITFTCHKWLPLLQQVNGYDLVYNWFSILNKKGHFVTGFVIMPNYLHIKPSLVVNEDVWMAGH